MAAYYNEHDPAAAAWLRELIRRGLIPGGEVDERSILDVRPDDLRGFTACHFFAGIGGWPYALRLAGWPYDQPVWTGSPPCQPFSPAGKGLSKDDPRHLAPHFVQLVRACRPPLLFGEQVASADVFGRVATAAKRAAGRALGIPAWAWWDDLSVRLEAARYAVGAGDISAASVGAPHIRQRCFFGAVRLADADGKRHDRLDPLLRPEARGRHEADIRQAAGRGDEGRPGPPDSFWSDADWLFCRDGRWRPVEPASQRMANGLSLCLGSMRGTCIGEQEEALNAEEALRFGRKALQVLRGFDDPEAFWLSIGGRIGFPQATFLLAVMCKYSRELGVISDSETSRGEQDGQAFLRAMRKRASQTPCSPQGSECSEQLTRELGDALSKLSQDSAQYRELVTSLASYTAGPLADGIPARMVRLRGYGNAICPQAAAEFVTAFMEAAAIANVEGVL
jgi:DNA (cytosine-5)-methyltransferase 1